MATLEHSWGTLAPFPDDLLSIKHTQNEAELYPNHGCARGGVGVLLATGARAGLSRLPATRSRSRPSSSNPSTSASLNGPPLSSGSFTSAMGPLREWEKGCGHVNNFVSAARSARIHDVPPASRWSAISFYENDPTEIRRHLEITNTLDVENAESKRAAREAVAARLNAMAAQQREAFRRQRLEQAVKYTRAGLPPRGSYPLVVNGAASGTGGSLISAGDGAGATAPAMGMGSGALSSSFTAGGFTQGGAPGNVLAAAVASLHGSRGSPDGTLAGQRGGPASSMRSFSAPASSMRHRSMSAAPASSLLRVYDRMMDEKAQAPRLLADQMASAAQQAAVERVREEVDQQVLGALEEFEINLAARNRKAQTSHIQVVK